MPKNKIQKKLAEMEKQLRNRAAPVAGKLAKQAAMTAAIMAGSAFGPEGAALGHMGGKALGKMVQAKVNKAVKGRGGYTMGRGGYTEGVVTNSLINGDSLGHTAKMHGVGDDSGSVILRKREFVMSVNSTGSAAFSATSLQVNAGLSSLFPFMAQVASNYTEFEFGQLIFEYRPVISKTSVSTVGSLGTIVMAANYNAGDQKFGSFPEMVDYVGAVEATAADKIRFGIECSPSELNRAQLYIRTGAVPTGQDIKTYDLAKFQIGLYGIPTAYPAGTQLGLLFVEYTCRCSKPRIYESLGRDIATDIFFGTTGATGHVPLGTAPVKQDNNSIGGTISKTNDTTYTFPDDYTGTVCLTFTMGSVGGAVLLSAPVPGGNLIAADYFFNGVSGESLALSSASGAVGVLNAYYSVTQASVAGGNTITVSALSATGTLDSMIIISSVNPNLVDIDTNNSPV